MPHRAIARRPDRRRLGPATGPQRIGLKAIGLLGAGLLSVAMVSACTSANGQGDAASRSSARHSSSGAASGAASTGASASSSTAAAQPKALTVVSVSPEAGAKAVSSDTDVVVTFSAALADASFTPRISPHVAGTWSRITTATRASALRFTPTAPWPASTRITVTVPAGVMSIDNQKLGASTTAAFVTKPLGTQRAQQLLAELGYLPLSFHVTGHAHTGKTAALADTGTYSWRWASARAVLGSYWSAGQANRLTTAALVDFQQQHGLASDGVAGPQTSTALVADALAHRVDPHTYDYVHVAKGAPESLTLYVNGAMRMHVAVSTGIKGATTFNGLFPVWRHVYFARMRGTDVDGTKYDDKIYWASYFNGGEAMHAYPRASYGFPQSNGCVEMAPSNAKKLWPFTPIGTPVSVTD